MMDHRQAVGTADDAQPKKTAPEDAPLVQSAATPPTAPPPSPPPDKGSIGMRMVWIYFGVIGVIAVLAFIRAMNRRAKGECGPVG
jgi:hypothetical protein